MKTKSRRFAAVAVAIVAIGVACVAVASYPGSIGQMGTENWIQNSPLATQQTSGGVQGSGSFTLATTGSVYLSSGGTAALSLPANWVVLSVSGSPGRSFDKFYVGPFVASRNIADPPDLKFKRVAGLRQRHDNWVFVRQVTMFGHPAAIAFTPGGSTLEGQRKPV